MLRFGPWDIDTIRALYQSGDVIDDFQPIGDSELPPPTTSGTIVVSVGGVYTTGTIAGTANEIEVAQTGADVTISLDAGYYLKGVTTAAQLRTKAGAGGLAVLNAAAASADVAADPGAAYVQAEVKAILDELRDLKAKLRSAGILAT